MRDRSHWNIPNIQPKDPVTLGLCSQRELDAAGRQGGQEGRDRYCRRRAGRLPTDDREALIEELRAERDATAQAAAEAAQEAEAEALARSQAARRRPKGRRPNCDLPERPGIPSKAGRPTPSPSPQNGT